MRESASDLVGRQGTWQRIHNSLWGNLLVLAVVAACVLAGLWLVGGWRGGGEKSVQGTQEDTAGQVSAVDVPDSDLPAPELGQKAPEFSGRTLEAEDFVLGESGRPTWLIFNATWCSNCRAEMPDVQQAHEEFGDRVDIVSVFINDSPSAVAQYSSTLKLSFIQIADANSDIAKLYRVMGVPSHYFIDANGTLTAIELGVLTPEAMEGRIAELLE